MKLKYYYFELSVVFFVLLYTLLYFSPSSYGIALQIFGAEGDGLYFSEAKGIRSDEWAVWTPYFQALVNNGFNRFDSHSLYPIDFRGFYSLPIHDWGLLFKPLLWPFLVFEPARAFSLHHALIIATFVIGWKQLFQRLFTKQVPYLKATLSLASLSLYYTAFSQMWWTTLGPLLAVTPWLFIIILSWRRHSLAYYLTVSYISVVWLLSHTYPPIIVSTAYLGIMFLCAYQPAIFKNPLRLTFTAISCLAAVLIVYLYFSDILEIMMSTVYPGQRVSTSGTVSPILWLSSVLPFITHSNFEDLLNLNICEVSAASSLLPLLCLCFLDYSKRTDDIKLHFIVFFLIFTLFSLWMLVPMPDLFGTVSLLYLVPGSRLLWALGLVVNIFSLHLLLNLGCKLTFKRFFLYSVLLIFTTQIPSMMGLIPYFEKSLWELISIPLLLLIIYVNRFTFMPFFNNVISLVFVAFSINLIYFVDFNPIQSSKPIFSVQQLPNVKLMNKLQENDHRGWLIKEGYPGALLYGAGLNSVTNVLMQPQIGFFRKMYPSMSENEFNDIFNRYAHIQLYNGTEPFVPQNDIIRLPINDLFSRNIIIDFEEEVNSSNITIKGYIENLEISKNEVYISGWGTIGPRTLILSNIPNEYFTEVKNTLRNDVAVRQNDQGLAASGFSIKLVNSKEVLSKIEDEGICIGFKNRSYGVNIVDNLLSSNAYDCKLLGVKVDD